VQRLDRAIDRAVHDLMAHEAPADLGARVVARIEQPVPVGAWWSPGRIAWAGAALAVLAIATYLAWPSRPAPLVEQEAVVAEARPPAPNEPATRPAPTEGASSEVGAAEPAAPTKTPERTAAASVVAPEPYEFTAPRLVEPLEEPPVVVIEPLPEPQLAIEPITIDRLTFEPVVIDPLRTGD